MAAMAVLLVMGGGLGGRTRSRLAQQIPGRLAGKQAGKLHELTAVSLGRGCRG